MTDQKGNLRGPHAHTQIRDVSARVIRGFTCSSFALMLGLGLVGCGSSRAPSNAAIANPIDPSLAQTKPHLIGSGELHFMNDEVSLTYGENLKAQNRQDDNVLDFIRRADYKSTVDLANLTRYVYVTYEVKNVSTLTLVNLNFAAKNKAFRNPGGVGFLNICDPDNCVYLSDPVLARKFQPFVPAVFDAGILTTLPEKSDFQVLLPAEAAALTQEARVVDGNDTILEYGHSIRPANNSSALAPGESGFFTAAFKVPLQNNGNRYAFSFNFATVTLPQNRHSRAPGETTATAVARAQAVGATQLGFMGTDGDVAPAPLRTVRNCDPMYYVGQVTTPCPTPPSPVSLSVASRVGTINKAMSFDAAGSEADPATTYAWDFGDGSSSASGYTSHTYTAPGKYSVSVTATTAGQSSSAQAVIAVLPEMKDISLNLNATGKDTVRFDAGEPAPGLSYEWDFGDTTTGNGSKVDHDYPTLGTYEVYLTIKDNQPLSGQSGTLGTISARSSRTGLTAQSGPPVLAYRGYTWVTRWYPRPQAKFSSTDGTTLGNTTGVAPLALSFDASASKAWNASLLTLDDTALTYTWDFGDGQVGSGKKVNHTFVKGGQYIVTLSVFDDKGQQEQAQAFVAVRGEKVFLRTVFEYPTLTGQSLSADDFGSRQGRLASGSSSLSAQDVTTSTYEDYFPYVMHKSAKLRRLSARWNAWSNGGSYGSGSLCQSLAVFYNQSSAPFLKFERDNTDGLICDFLSVSGSNIGPLAARGQSDLFVQASPFFQRMNFAVFSGLRVPRLALAVLPDRMIPGELASPFINVNTVVNDDTGKTELIETVQARESEVKNGILEFKVPVYAVNDDGKLITTANGYFRGRFDSLELTESDCGDCVMVNGKAYLTVRIKTEDYGLNGKLVDLSRIKLQSNLLSCGTDNSPWAASAGSAMLGCTTLTTSNEAPTGNEKVVAIKYKLPPYAFQFMGHMFLGKSKEQVKAELDAMVESNYQAFRTFVVDNMIPFYSSGKALVEVVSLCAQQNQCNAGAILLSGVAVVADVLPATKLLATPLRLAGTASRIEARVLAGAIDEAVLPKVLAKAPIEDVIVDLDKVTGNTAKAIKECGRACSVSTDNAINRMVAKGKTKQEGLQKLEDAIKRDEAAGISPQDRFNHYETSITCDLNSFSPDTLVWTSSGLQPISSLFAQDGTGTRANAPTQVLSYNEATGQNELNLVTHIFINNDPNITTLTLESNGQVETLTTTPEHPFYTSSAWKDAGQLKLGDRVRKQDGTFGVVQFVNTVQNTRVMYNLEVARAHTFFVGASGWLVHNASKVWDCNIEPNGAKDPDKIPSRIANTNANQANAILKKLPEICQPATIAIGLETATKRFIIALNSPTMLANNCLNEIERIWSPSKFRVLKPDPNLTQAQLSDLAGTYHSERQIYEEALRLGDEGLKRRIGISRQQGPCPRCNEFFKDKTDVELAIYDVN